MLCSASKLYKKRRKKGKNKRKGADRCRYLRQPENLILGESLCVAIQNGSDNMAAGDPVRAMITLAS